jgi:MOSC domain-containing protein YiiM
MAEDTTISGSVASTNRSATHTFSKTPHPEIRLLAGLGVEGDAHMGEKVKHRSRVKQNPDQPNLRQVHFIPSELHAELVARGYEVAPGLMGENITTEGIDMNVLPVGTVLALGPEARVELTGLRNPCPQLNGLQQGLMKELVYNDENGNTVRLGGVMSVVLEGGVVRPGDAIVATLPPPPHSPMDRI